jgi:hypothetical protein
VLYTYMHTHNTHTQHTQHTHTRTHTSARANVYTRSSNIKKAFINHMQIYRWKHKTHATTNTKIMLHPFTHIKAHKRYIVRSRRSARLGLLLLLMRLLLVELLYLAPEGLQLVIVSCLYLLCIPCEWVGVYVAGWVSVVRLDFPAALVSPMEKRVPTKTMWVAVGYSLWSRLCACGSALGLSGSGSCGSGLAGSGDIDHVRVIQPVAGPVRPYAPRGLEPTTNVVFVGTLFRRATNAAGKSGRITGSSCPARFPGCISSPMEKRVPTGVGVCMSV